MVSEGSTSRQKLVANLLAQMLAFAVGKDDADRTKAFPGNRPSTLLIAPQLGPKQLGALYSHFENKVMFQGFIWNLNSFDQEGVQLGKVLAKKALSGLSLKKPTDDELLDALIAAVRKIPNNKWNRSIDRILKDVTQYDRKLHRKMLPLPLLSLEAEQAATSTQDLQ